MTQPNQLLAQQRMLQAKAALYLALMDLDPTLALIEHRYLEALMADVEVRRIMDTAFGKKLTEPSGDSHA